MIWEVKEDVYHTRGRLLLTGAGRIIVLQATVLKIDYLSTGKMQSLTLITAMIASLVRAQGGGLGCPPPAPEILSTTKSGVLPVLPTPFSGVETLEGAIVVKGPPDPA